jgi:hypothetical protein
MPRLVVALSAAIVLSACERTSPSVLDMSSPDPAQFLLAVPESDFRLSDAERSNLNPLVDRAALEAFLGRVRPEHRATILKDINDLGSKGPVAVGQMTTDIPDRELRAAVAGIFDSGRRQGDGRP